MFKIKEIMERNDYVIFGYNGVVRTGQIRAISPKTVKLKLDTGYDKRIKITDILELIKGCN